MARPAGVVDRALEGAALLAVGVMKTHAATLIESVRPVLRRGHHHMHSYVASPNSSSSNTQLRSLQQVVVSSGPKQPLPTPPQQPDGSHRSAPPQLVPQERQFVVVVMDSHPFSGPSPAQSS